MDNEYRLKSEEEAEAFDRDYNSREYVCPICGKTFRIPMYVSLSDYVYTVSVRDKKARKTYRRKCCSYSCYRKGSQ